VLKYLRMFSMISVDQEQTEFRFSDGRRGWTALNYGHGWGLQVTKGLVMYFGSFTELIMFLANEEKLWVEE